MNYINNSTTILDNNTFDDHEIHDHVTFAGGVIMLVLCMIGVYGNVLSVIIFTRRRMRSAINILLAGLSVIDLFLLFMCIPVFVTPMLFDYFRITNKYYDVIIVLCFYPLTLTAQTCSVWTFVVISLERYLAVCRPFVVQKYVSVKRTKQALIIVIFLSVLYNLIRFWEYRLVPVNERLTEDAKIHDTLLRLEPIYLSVYYTALFLITHFLIPFMIILVLNVYVISAIKVSQQERRRLSQHQSNQHKTSRMIVIVTVIFALCNFLTFILNIWEASSPDLFTSDNPNYRTAFTMMDTSNICIMINSTINFVIYLVYCKRYRLYFLRYHKKLYSCFADVPNNGSTEELNSNCDGYSKAIRTNSYRITTKLSRSMVDVDV